VLVLAILVQAVLCRPNGYSGYPRQPPATAPALARWGDSRGLRLMTTTLANSNLIWNQEEVGVFDPILNRALSEFMMRYFPVYNSGFHMQVSEVPLALSPTQFDVLRFMGVEALEAAAFQMPGQVPVDNGLSRVPDPLPRAFLLSTAAAAEADARCAANDIPGAVSIIQADLAGRGGLAVSMRTNGLRLRGSATGAHPLLVVNQAYSTSWNHEGQRGRKFCGMFPSWSVAAGNEQVWNVRYWPRGLTPALILSAFALVAFLAAAVFSRRRTPPVARVSSGT
jgi:hypothetical protein